MKSIVTVEIVRINVWTKNKLSFAIFLSYFTNKHFKHFFLRAKYNVLLWNNIIEICLREWYGKNTKLENLSRTIDMLVEEIHVSEFEGLDHRFLHSSQQSKVKHNFKDILGVVCPKGRTSWSIWIAEGCIVTADAMNA